MARLEPLPIDTTPELAEHFRFFLGTLGFTPNSVLTMQRRPKLVRALAQLNAAAMDPEGEVDLGFRRLVGHVASRASGCRYCMAHTALGAKNFGVDDAKLAAVWEYRTSPLYSEAERVALDFALAAASQPNDVSDALFAAMRAHWTDGQIVEILGVVALFGFLNRWNDTMATPLEPVAADIGERFLATAGGIRGSTSADRPLTDSGSGRRLLRTAPARGDRCMHGNLLQERQRSGVTPESLSDFFTSFGKRPSCSGGTDVRGRAWRPQSGPRMKAQMKAEGRFPARMDRKQ